MGARQKLNRAYVNGALLCGAIVGLVSESWLLFILVVIGCLLGNYYDGQIRPGGRRRN